MMWAGSVIFEVIFLNIQETYCRHQQQQEENTKRLIDEFLAEQKRRDEIRKTARDEAKKFIDSERRNIEIELDKRSLAEVETQLRNLF